VCKSRCKQAERGKHGKEAEAKVAGEITLTPPRWECRLINSTDRQWVSLAVGIEKAKPLLQKNELAEAPI
jgi:hypothetical protein